MAMDLDVKDEHGAFVPGPRAVREPLGAGVLTGLRFAVKDLIDVAGVVTTGGNPDWAASHAPALHNAPSVSALLQAGATLAGKTVTDELAFSLEGENAFFGTPRNPRAADRLPGGSSSGSAVAVAAGLVDFALGTDTGGSVRVPASFCGVFGFRPTHGRVSLDGVLPFAPSYDTVGWFARSGEVLERAGRVLLGTTHDDGEARAKRWHFHLVQDAFDMVDVGGRVGLLELARQLGAKGTVMSFKGRADDWLRAYQVLQGDEIWQNLGDWITRHQPTFGPSIQPRFDSVAHLDPQEVQRWQSWRHQQTQSIRQALNTDADGALHAWILPTTPGVALRKGASIEDIGRFYTTALALNALAGHTGLPQFTLPIGQHEGLPLGLSIIGPPHSDEALLALAATLPASFTTTC